MYPLRDRHVAAIMSMQVSPLTAAVMAGEVILDAGLTSKRVGELVPLVASASVAVLTVGVPALGATRASIAIVDLRTVVAN